MSTAKMRGGRKTKETPNHRCWVCDHRDEWAKKAAENPASTYYASYAKLECAYARRLKRRPAAKPAL